MVNVESVPGHRPLRIILSAGEQQYPGWIATWVCLDCVEEETVALSHFNEVVRECMSGLPDVVGGIASRVDLFRVREEAEAFRTWHSGTAVIRVKPHRTPLLV